MKSPSDVPGGDAGVGVAPARGSAFEALLQVPTAPQTLGRYVVLGTLGRGGMGTVFEAFDRALDRRVAVKVLHRELDEKHAARLLREAQAMAKLSHPNVVQVYEVDRVEGQTFVAMELVEGQTLRDWMGQEPRPSWQRCVEVFHEVGKGLAAAHACGLVHRDFKPANAIIDEDGRPRVLDFGLARRAGVETEGESIPAVALEAEAKDDGPTLGAPLTRTGAVLGTPAYMPPEQMKGHEADVRSDQFSFCVSLFEAVYGTRPFEGSSMMALMVSMAQGDMPAPRGIKVPGALRAILQRGLAIDPEQRWPSMDRLLATLNGLVVPRGRTGIALGIMGGLVAIGVGLGMERYVEVQQRCTGASAQLEGIWDDERRTEVKDAILGMDVSYGPGTWGHVVGRLDDYARAWRDKHVEVCEATAVRHEQSEEAMDLRMECLRERKTTLGAAAKVLAQLDVVSVEKAVHLVVELPGLAHCDDLEALGQRLAPPEDPQVAEEVVELRERLEYARALRISGQYDDALSLAEEVVVRAETLVYPPLLAEAWLARGRARNERAEYPEAERDLDQAYALAAEHRHFAVAMGAATVLTMVGYATAQYDEGLWWGRVALPLARGSGEALAEANIRNSLGAVLLGQGEYAAAREQYQQALSAQEHALGSTDLSVAKSLNNLGIALAKEGEYEEALVHHRRALAIKEETLDPAHPSVAASLRNIGAVLSSQGNYEEAGTHYRRALAIREDAFGPVHPFVADSLGSIGTLLVEQGKYDDALVYFRRSLVIKEGALGPSHPSVAATLGHIGVVSTEQGKYDDALAPLPAGAGHPGDCERASAPLRGLYVEQYRRGSVQPGQVSGSPGPFPTGVGPPGAGAGPDSSLHRWIAGRDRHGVRAARRAGAGAEIPGTGRGARGASVGGSSPGICQRAE